MEEEQKIDEEKEQEIIALEAEVAELLDWKNQISRERFSYPLDYASRDILNRDLLIYKKTVTFTNVFSDFIDIGQFFEINADKRVILMKRKLYAFSANAGTDFITNSGGAHNLKNDDRIVLGTDGTLPSGLSEVTIYYIINRTGTTFQVSTTLGGSAVNFTDAGFGTHYYAKL